MIGMDAKESGQTLGQTSNAQTRLVFASRV